MSVVVKSTELSYKDPTTGKYTGINVLAEKKTSEFLDAIEAKGEAVLSDIPASYDDLNNIVADSYNDSTTYSVGDYVRYYDRTHDKLYRCITAITTPEAWTSRHWTEVVMADEVSDLKSALNTTDMLVNDNGAYVNYNYDTPYSQTEASSGSWNKRIGINRLKFRVTLNKHTDLGYPDNVLRIKVNGEIGFSLTNAGTDAWTTGITLKAGHKYATIVKKLSGTSTYQPSGAEATDLPPVAVAYAAGTHTDQTGSTDRSENTVKRYFVAESGKSYNIVLYIPSAAYMFTNAEFLVLLEDRTESPFEQIDSKLSDVESEVIAITGATDDISAQFVFTDGKRVNYVNGAINNSTGRSASGFVDIQNYNRLEISRIYFNDNASANGLAFYSDNNDESYISGLKEPKENKPTEDGYGIYTVSVPENAKYIRVTWFLSSAGKEFECTGYTDGLIYTPTSDVPEYYYENSYITDKVNSINTIAAVLGKRSMQTFFITDYHLEDNARKSPSLIHYLIDKTGIKTVVFGGDAMNHAYDSKVGGYELLCEFLSDFSKVFEKTNAYLITGNHEYNNANLAHDSGELSAGPIYNLFNKPNFYKIHQLRDGTHNTNSFYVDDDTANIRTYYIDCTSSAVLPIFTAKMVADSLMSVPEGYTVMVFSHIGIVYSKDESTIPPTYTVTGLNERFALITQAMAAMDAGATTTLTITVDGTTYSWNYDFSNNQRQFIGCIVGHAHIDGYYIYGDRFPVIVTLCDTGAYRSSHVSRVAGTITEQAFDCVQIDVDTKRIYCTRIGYGNDRVFGFGDGAGMISD